MKVKDVLKLLENCDQEAEVIVCSSNFELNHAEVPVSMVHQYDTGSKEKQTFRDAFDGETYDKEVYSIVGGKENVVLIR